MKIDRLQIKLIIGLMFVMILGIILTINSKKLQDIGFTILALQKDK